MSGQYVQSWAIDLDCLDEREIKGDAWSRKEWRSPVYRFGDRGKPFAWRDSGESKKARGAGLLSRVFSSEASGLLAVRGPLPATCIFWPHGRLGFYL